MEDPGSCWVPFSGQTYQNINTKVTHSGVGVVMTAKKEKHSPTVRVVWVQRLEYALYLSNEFDKVEIRIEDPYVILPQQYLLARYGIKHGVRLVIVA
jgi:hypothetical protein